MKAMYDIFVETGVNVPPQLTRIRRNPPSILVDSESGQQLGELTVIGYKLLEVVHRPREASKRDKKKYEQEKLSYVSRRIIHIYQACRQYEGKVFERVALEGADEAGTFIIRMMMPIIRKYFQLLTTGTADFNTQDTKNFLSLYATPNNVKDENLRKRIRGLRFQRRLPEDVFSFMIKTSSGLRAKFFFMPPQEIFNELCYLILKAALKFHTYRTLAFWYYLTGGRKRGGGDGTFKYMVRSFIAEQSGNFTHDPRGDYPGQETPDKSMMSPEESVMLGVGNELDTAWTIGDAISWEYEEAFKPLSVLQREVLRRWYGDDRTNPTEVARELGITRNEVGELRRTALEHISGVLNLEIPEE